jgi:hypothetical protein
MKNNLARVTIELTEDQKKKLKVLAAICDMTIKDFIIEKTIGHEPNKETLKSFNDYQKNIGLKRHSSFDAFWKDINS